MNNETFGLKHQNMVSTSKYIKKPGKIKLKIKCNLNFAVITFMLTCTFFLYRITNRLEESLNIFGTIVNNRSFRDVSIILFLNKTDLLIQKVRSRQSNISHYFTDFVVSISCLSVSVPLFCLFPFTFSLLEYCCKTQALTEY